MKATELRIGNLVLHDLIIKEVIAIAKDDIVVDGFGGKSDSFQPIPLTEEWLLKFGFTTDNLFAGGMIANGLHYSPRFQKNGVLISVQSDNFDSSQKFKLLHYYTNIESVHQLQNLYFALTGSELEIK